jgi:transcriptional regulator with XRE-family HTH domain
MLQRFPEKLRTLRERRNMTQEQLGLALELDRVYISNLERGRRRPGVEMLYKIARFFEVSVDQLALDELEV